MTILLATPIHSEKDYCMRKWLEHIKQFNLPVLLVDNSPSEELYSETLSGYIAEVGLTNVTVVHIDIASLDRDERLANAREEIREYVVDNNYDYWFSLESDVFVSGGDIAPSGAVAELLKYTPEFDGVHHSVESRADSYDDFSWGFDLSLISKATLEEFTFLLEFGEVDPLMPLCWHGGESWFNRRMYRAGYKFLYLYGVIGTNHI
jgi:hypothetical protein